MTKFLKGMMVFWAVGVGFYGLAYFAMPEFTQEAWGHHLRDAPWALYAHFVFGPVALITGSLQFFPKLRTKHRRFHRICGRIYVAACLAGGVAGFTLALGSVEGMMAVTGFATLAVFWIYATYLAYRFARNREFELHKRWMLRSYAMTFGAVTLRIMIPMANILDIEGAYPYIAWLCWTVNLAIVEVHRMQQNRAATVAT
jgi:uncharacterized membrane protein